MWPNPLPRTATRKVKRSEVRKELLHLLEVSRASRKVSVNEVETATLNQTQKWLYSVLSALTGESITQFTPQSHLLSDLSLSSLQRVELRMMIEDRLGRSLVSEQYMQAETIASLTLLLEGQALTVKKTELDPQSSSSLESKPLWQRLPSPIKDLGQSAIDLGRGLAFNTFNVKVKGREHIPFNQQSIVIANHCSHLDLGLIKEALQSYGDHLCALAAQDYFFDDEYKEALLSQFTLLLPVDRSASLERSLKPAEDAIAQGYSVLIYPEGTRSTDGELQEFKSGVGYLQSKTKASDSSPLSLNSPCFG